MNNRICRAAREQPPVVKFGLVHENMRVRVRGHGEVALADVLADPNVPARKVTELDTTAVTRMTSASRTIGPYDPRLTDLRRERI